MLFQGAGQDFGPGSDMVRATLGRWRGRAGGVEGLSVWKVHSSECRAPGTSPPVPCPPLPTVPCAGAHSADTEQTLLAPAPGTGAEGPTFRAPGGDAAGYQPGGDARLLVGVFLEAHSVLCLAHIRQNPDIHRAPIQEHGESLNLGTPPFLRLEASARSWGGDPRRPWLLNLSEAV